MLSINRLHPKQIFRMLDAIDNESPSYTLDRPSALRRTFWVLTSVCVCLLLIHYLKNFSSLQATLYFFSGKDKQQTHEWLWMLQQSGFLGLIRYSWWTFWHIIGYVLIPFLFIRYVFKGSFKEMGWRWGNTHTHWQGYALLISPILFFIFLVSFRDDFLQHYPFYEETQRSYFDLIVWELLYLTQFICLEFFFRGYVLNALRPAMGANAIWVMCVPYLMIHFPKLWLEATGAILFGLFLGILALRSKSIWGWFFCPCGHSHNHGCYVFIKTG